MVGFKRISKLIEAKKGEFRIQWQNLYNTNAQMICRAEEASILGYIEEANASIISCNHVAKPSKYLFHKWEIQIIRPTNT